MTLRSTLLLALLASITAPAGSQILGQPGYGKPTGRHSGGIALDEGKKAPAPRRSTRNRPAQRVILRRPNTAPRTPSYGGLFGLGGATRRTTAGTSRRSVPTPRTAPRTAPPSNRGRMSLTASYRRSQYDGQFAAAGKSIQRAGRQAKSELSKIAAAYKKARTKQRRDYLRRLYNKKKAGYQSLVSRYGRWKAANKSTQVTFHGTTVAEQRRVLAGLRRAGGRLGPHLTVRRTNGRLVVRSHAGRPNYSRSYDVTHTILGRR